ncbi:MAG: hypothetical protein AB7I38_11910 [Dehalococcoidia bacterium]
MSYIVRDDAPRRPRGSLLAAVAGVGVLAAVGVVLLVWVAGPGEPERPTVSWTVVGSQPVPSSVRHGPMRTGDGLAAGFSHDELGAALAAVHLSARLVPGVPPQVYQQTARRQGIGDVEEWIALVDRSREVRTVASPDDVGRELYYRVVDGDPGGDTVQISVAAATEAARRQGGYVELSRTLRWVDGDWKIQLPLPPRAIIESLASYSPLEPDDE